MTDQPAEPDFAALDYSALGHTTRNNSRAYEAVNEVIGWYTRELTRPQRAEGPNQRPMKELWRGLIQAQKDKRLIPDVDAEELQGLIDHYVALYREFTALD